MNDGAIIAVVAIVFGSLVVIFRTIVTAVTGGRDRNRDSAKDTGESHSQRELFDLAMRLQSRVETLERLLDSAQPEWRGKP
jgi:phage shock protein B